MREQCHIGKEAEDLHAQAVNVDMRLRRTMGLGEFHEYMAPAKLVRCTLAPETGLMNGAPEA